MNSDKFLKFFFLIFFISCANPKLSKSESCSYPQEKLEKGGLINRIIDKNALDDSFKNIFVMNIQSIDLFILFLTPLKKIFQLWGKKLSFRKKNLGNQELS